MYTLQGDLAQITKQENFLKKARIPFISEPGFPGQLNDEEQFKIALRQFYRRKVEGWWNYKEELIKYGICTEEQYMNKLKETKETLGDKENE